MLFRRASGQRIGGQGANLCHRLHRTLRHPTQGGNPLSQQIHRFADAGRHSIKQFVQGDKIFPLHVPMRLFGLQLQVEAGGQMLIQQRGDFLTNRQG